MTDKLRLENNLNMFENFISDFREILKENKELDSEVKSLKEKNSRLASENEQLHQEKKEISDTADQLYQKKENLCQKNAALEAELDAAKNQFSVYYQYQELPEEIQEAYNQIIDSSSPMAFAVSGADKEHIELFYEKICMEWTKYPEENLKVLNRVFDYLFKMFQVNYPGYERIPVHTGEPFDSSLHRRTSSSSAVGTVTKVIIAGYRTKSHSQCIKSFVEIG